ncbi:hypothetical protein QVD17_38579 [Tagetes erecta]|uniref:Zinc finger PHD-type domain-containing protein n=1 Tax=Tagetes erecta TaxID=13708 RepID=A0AAD8NED9_TARER|nr:hypothetical protein QVD17_38579 [Tagetes erecta]
MHVDDIAGDLTEDSDSDGEEIHFDTICAICDNGGILTCCDGKCFRSFHATPDSEVAQDSNCETLCLNFDELQVSYTCENCRYNLHQCFVCAELGSSNELSNTEVFRCSSAFCRHFYHPNCVARLLQQNDENAQRILKERIFAGEPFICPAHRCAVCNQIENDRVEDLQFAICRRCPKSYHRRCLPRGIMFDHQAANGVEIRAWDGMLTKSRALLYCLEHEIDPELATPARTILFRDPQEEWSEVTNL